MACTGINRVSPLPTAADAGVVGRTDGGASGHVKKRRGETSQVAATALGPPIASDGVSETPKLAEPLSQRCKWAITLYQEGEKSLARKRLQILIPDNTLEMLIGNWNKGKFPSAGFTYSELWQLLNCLEERVTYIGQSKIETTSPKLLREEACRSIGRPLASTTMAPSEEELILIFSGKCGSVALRGRASYPSPAIPTALGGGAFSNFLPQAIANNVMEFVGYIRPLACVSRQWKLCEVHALSSFTSTLIEYVDWLRESVDPSSMNARWLVNELFMQTIRGLRGHFTQNRQYLLTRVDHKILNLMHKPSLAHVRKDLTVSRENLKSWFKYNPQLLADAPDAIKQDRALMLEIVQLDGILLQYIPEKYRSDREFVRLALSQNPIAYQSVLGDSLTDVVNLKHVLRYNGLLLRFAPEEIRRNREYLKMAISSQCDDPRGRGLDVFELAIAMDWIEDQWHDREILECVLIHNREGETVLGNPLLPADLQSDKDFNFKAISNNFRVEFEHIHPTLAEDVEFMKSILMQEPTRFIYIAPHANDENDNSLWRLSRGSVGMERLSEARKAIKKDYKVFEYFPAEFRGMAEFVEIAVKASSKMISHVTSDWLTDSDKFEQILNWAPDVTDNIRTSYHCNKLAVLTMLHRYDDQRAFTFAYKYKTKQMLQSLALNFVMRRTDHRTTDVLSEYEDRYGPIGLGRDDDFDEEIIIALAELEAPKPIVEPREEKGEGQLT